MERRFGMGYSPSRRLWDRSILESFWKYGRSRGTYNWILSKECHNDLMVKQGASPGNETHYVFAVNTDKNPCFTASNLEWLKFGIEDHVLKHGNCLDTMCDHCFSDREHLKVGSGTVCQEEKHKRVGGTMEVVIVISDLLETTQHCNRSCDGKTEVLYFDNFSSVIASTMATSPHGLSKLVIETLHDLCLRICNCFVFEIVCPKLVSHICIPLTLSDLFSVIIGSRTFHT